jgi:hypothetical protein
MGLQTIFNQIENTDGVIGHEERERLDRSLDDNKFVPKSGRVNRKRISKLIAEAINND